MNTSSKCSVQQQRHADALKSSVSRTCTCDCIAHLGTHVIILLVTLNADVASGEWHGRLCRPGYCSHLCGVVDPDSCHAVHPCLVEWLDDGHILAHGKQLLGSGYTGAPSALWDQVVQAQLQVQGSHTSGLEPQFLKHGDELRFSGLEGVGSHPSMCAFCVARSEPWSCMGLPSPTQT